MTGEERTGPLVVADVVLVMRGDFWAAIGELFATPTIALLIYGMLTAAAIVHELGHAAGNARHTAQGCHDTPMVVGLANGEWWRSPQDWSYRRCTGGTRASARMAVVRVDEQVVDAG